MLHIVAGQTLYDLLLVAFAVLVMPVMSARNGRKLNADPSASRIARYLRTMARGWASADAVVAIWIVLHRSFAALGLGWPPGPAGKAGLALIALAALAVAILVANAPRLVTPARYPVLREQMRHIKILPRSTPEMLVFLGVSVTAGVWEELIYRGFLIWFLLPYAGLIGAVALSSIVFGLGHLYQGWRGVLSTATLGLVFALGFVFSQSLWWVMAAHALVDLYGGTMAWRVLRMPAPQAA